MHSFGKSLLFILQGQVQGHLLTRSCAIYRCHVLPLLVGYSVPALDSGLTASIWLALANRIRWKWWWARVKPGPQETHSMLSSAITMRTSPAQLVEGGETHGAEPSHCRDQDKPSLYQPMVSHSPGMEMGLTELPPQIPVNPRCMRSTL